MKTVLKSGSINDRQVFKNLNLNPKPLRNKVVNELRKAKANFFIDIIKEEKGNSKLIWRNINKLSKKDSKQNQGRGHELKIQGILTNDPNEIASTFNTYFTESVQNLSRNFGARIKEISAPNFTKLVFRITEVPHRKICNFKILKGKRYVACCTRDH